MPTWPTTLPLPAISMSGSERRPIIGTQMEGRTRQRRRWTGKQEEYNVQWTFNETELPIFETFVDTDLEGGVLFFDIDLPIDGAVATKSVRLKGGIFRKQYRVHLNWVVTGIIEVEIVQGVNDPDQAFEPLYFQPEFIITEDTLMGEQHRNALIRVQGVTVPTPVVLSILFGDEASEFLPLGIQHEGGQGDVIIRMLEEGDDGISVNPFTLATQLGIHIFSFEDPSMYVEDPGGGIETILDQNPDDTVDVNSVRGTDDSRKSIVVGTVLQVRISGNLSFEAFEPSEGTGGKGCFIFVAEVTDPSGERTILALGPSNDRPAWNYTVSNGSWACTWGGGGSQNATSGESESNVGPTDTAGRKALFMMYYPTGTTAPEFYVDGLSLNVDSSNTGVWPTAYWDATIWGKDDVNESVGIDMDVSEYYVGTTATGDAAEGLTESQFLELAEAVADKHGITWLG